MLLGFTVGDDSLAARRRCRREHGRWRRIINRTFEVPCDRCRSNARGVSYCTPDTANIAPLFYLVLAFSSVDVKNPAFIEIAPVLLRHRTMLPPMTRSTEYSVQSDRYSTTEDYMYEPCWTEARPHHTGRLATYPTETRRADSVA